MGGAWLTSFHVCKVILFTFIRRTNVSFNISTYQQARCAQVFWYRLLNSPMRFAWTNRSGVVMERGLNMCIVWDTLRWMKLPTLLAVLTIFYFIRTVVYSMYNWFFFFVFTIKWKRKKSVKVGEIFWFQLDNPGIVNISIEIENHNNRWWVWHRTCNSSIIFTQTHSRSNWMEHNTSTHMYQA